MPYRVVEVGSDGYMLQYRGEIEGRWYPSSALSITKNKNAAIREARAMNEIEAERNRMNEAKVTAVVWP